MTAPTNSNTASAPGLDDLFDRVNQLLGETTSPAPKAPDPQNDDTVPMPAAQAPQEGFIRGSRRVSVIQEFPASLIERLILKFMFQVGRAPSRQIANQVKLPYKVIEPVLKQLRTDKHIDLAGTTNTGDAEYAVTEAGQERGKRYHEECTYFGSCPVSLEDYINSVNNQSIAGQVVTSDDLKRAFDGLIINSAMLDKLGPAVNSGRGMFLFGMPGNGKTSIAERVTEAFGSTIWMPRAMYIEGEIMRIFDPWCSRSG